MVNLRINQTFSTGAVRNARRMNQIGMKSVSPVPGYECRMAFPEARTPQNRTYRTGVNVHSAPVRLMETAPTGMG